MALPYLQILSFRGKVFDTSHKSTLVVVGGQKKIEFGQPSGENYRLRTEFCDLSEEKINCTVQDSILYEYVAPPILFKVAKDYGQALYSDSCLPKN